MSSGLATSCDATRRHCPFTGEMLMHFRSLVSFSLPVFLFTGAASLSHAATTNVKTTDNLANVVASAHAGDTVQLGTGTYNVSSPVTVPSGVTIAGTSVDATHVVFNLAGGNTTAYGFLIAGNAQNVTITHLDLISNHGVIGMYLGSGYKNIVITRNNLQYGGGQFSNGTLVMGISGTVLNNGLQITHNYFHDSPGSVRNWCIWYPTNANLDNNLFYNIADGGQICTPGDHVSFSFNYGTNMHRMGQEVSMQDNSDFTCNGNVFYSYVTPYYDTEGVSIVGGTGPVNVTNNYFCSNAAAGTSWGQADGGGLHRFGYAIECTGSPSNVSGNVLAGRWAEYVASDISGAKVTSNTCFGSGIWANFAGEPGPWGFGSVVASNNTIDPNLSHTPAPPTNTFAGPKMN